MAVGRRTGRRSSVRHMLAAMLDGRAHTATELAHLAGIAAPTASGHLAKLSRAKLIGVVAQGDIAITVSRPRRSDGCSKASWSWPASSHTDCEQRRDGPVADGEPLRAPRRQHREGAAP
jgi:hypothetical protein